MISFIPCRQLYCWRMLWAEDGKCFRLKPCWNLQIGSARSVRWDLASRPANYFFFYSIVLASIGQYVNTSLQCGAAKIRNFWRFHLSVPQSCTDMLSGRHLHDTAKLKDWLAVHAAHVYYWGGKFPGQGSWNSGELLQHFAATNLMFT